MILRHCVRFVFVACILTVSLACPSAYAHVGGDRERAAKQLVSEIQRAGLHKIYVADFLSPSGKREFGGCYFSSAFSTLIAKRAADFSVMNRIEAQNVLMGLNMTPRSITNPDDAARLARALNVDGLLSGTVVAAKGHVKIGFSLWSATANKEVWTGDFSEPLQRGIVANWPPDGNPGLQPVYFMGLDGVSVPRPLYHPDPSFSDEARRAHFNGNILSGVLIGSDGQVKTVWIIDDPGFGLAKRCIDMIKTWKFEPAKDANGTPVPVSVPVETSFKTL